MLCHELSRTFVPRSFFFKTDMLGYAKLQNTLKLIVCGGPYTLNPTGQRCCDQCDFIMADPPYLNPDAVKKFATTIRLLARDPAGAPET